MDKYDAIEVAYNNGYKAGYEAGKRDAAKKGKWDADGRCSVCGSFDGQDPFGSNFCCYCGADMREKHGESST